METAVSLFVEEEMLDETDYMLDEMPVEEEKKFPVIPVIAGAAALILLLACILISKWRKKKKAAKELEEDLADLAGGPDGNQRNG